MAAIIVLIAALAIAVPVFRVHCRGNDLKKSELFIRLEDSKLSHDQVRNILESVEDKTGEKIGNYTVQELLDLSKISRDDCKDLQKRSISSEDVDENHRVHLYTYKYYLDLVEICGQDIEAVFKESVDSIDPRDLLAVDQLVRLLTSSATLGSSQVEVAVEAYVQTLPGKEASIKQAHLIHLENICKRVLDKIGIASYIDVWSKHRYQVSAGLLSPWEVRKNVCIIYGEWLSPSAKAREASWKSRYYRKSRPAYHSEKSGFDAGQLLMALLIAAAAAG